MICVDTNVWVDFLRGVDSGPTRFLDSALKDQQVVMNPFILAELLSSPKITSRLEKNLLALPRLEIDHDFFIRAAKLRRSVYRKGFGVSIQDVFIAQSCIDGSMSLLTQDADFKPIAKYSELELTLA